MEKTIIVAASFYKRSRYFNEAYNHLPGQVRDELLAACSLAAESTKGIVTIGFYPDGAVFIETDGAADDFDYDEIGARLLADSLAAEKAELFRSLQLWYAAFCTEEGKEILKGQ